MQTTHVKALSDHRIGGYLVVWGNPAQKDLQGEYFTPDTKLWLDLYGTRPALFDHAQDRVIKSEIVGVIDTLKADEFGVWAEAQLDRRKKYVDVLMKLVEQGKLNWSSGSMPHLVEVDPDGRIKQWPIVEGSLTPTPAEPRRTEISALKSIDGFSEIIDFDRLSAVKADSEGSGDNAPETPVESEAEAVPDEQPEAIETEAVPEPAPEESPLGDTGDSTPEPESDPDVEPETEPAPAMAAEPKPEKDTPKQERLTMNEQLQAIIAATAQVLGTQLQPEQMEQVIQKVTSMIQQRTGMQQVGAPQMKAAFNDEAFRNQVIDAIKSLVLPVDDITSSMTETAQKGVGRGGEGVTQPRGGSPRVSDMRTKYHDMDAEDMAFYLDMRNRARAAHHKSPWLPGEQYLREMADKAEKSAMSVLNTYGALENEDNPHSDVLAIKGIRAVKSDELNYATQTGYGEEWVATLWQARLWEIVRRENRVASQFQTFDMPSNPFTIPLEGSDPTVHRVSETTDDSQLATAGVVTASKISTDNRTLTAYKMGTRSAFSADWEEDAIIQVIPTQRRKTLRAMANAVDYNILQAHSLEAASPSGNINKYDAATLAADTDFWLLGINGLLVAPLVDNAATATLDFGNAGPSLTQIRNVRRKLDRKFLHRLSDLVWFVDELTAEMLLDIDEFLTMDKIGNRATVLTGQVGVIDGTPVVLTDQLGTADVNGMLSNTPANNVMGRMVCVYRPHYRIGYRRRIQTWMEYSAAHDAYQMGSYVRIAFKERDSDVATTVGYNISV